MKKTLDFLFLLCYNVIVNYKFERREPSRMRCIMEFFERFAAGGIGFTEIGGEISNVFARIFAPGGTILSFWSTAMDWLTKFIPFAWIIPSVLALLSLIQVFFGKKLLGLQKFLLCLAIGFACGTVFIHPLLCNIGITFMADWVVGLIVGVVAAILSRLVYFLAYIVAAGCAGYILCLGGILPESISQYLSFWYVGVGVAVVFVVLALLLRRFIEMLGTAVLGGYTLFLSFVAILASFGWEIGAEYKIWRTVGFLAVCGLLGFIVQLKTARRD